MKGQALLVGLLLVGVVSSAVLPRAYKKTFNNDHQVQQQPRQEPRVGVVFNDAFDQLLGRMESWVIEKGLDPLQLADQGFSFTITDLLGIEWTTELSLTKGWMINLSQFERASDAMLDVVNDTLSVFTVDIRLPAVSVNYDYTAKVFNIGPEGSLVGKVENLTVYLEVNVDRNTKQLSLSQYYFADAGTLTVELNDGGLLEWIANGIIDFFASIFEDSILGVVEGQVREILENTLSQLTLDDILNIIADSRRNKH